MKTVWNQATGKSPEPLWMTIIGAVCVFTIPAAFCLTLVAIGVN